MRVMIAPNLVPRLLVLFCSAQVLFACSSGQNADTTAAVNEGANAARGIVGKSQNGSIRSIELVYDQPDFPPGAGRELFMARCTVCHSLRYVTMQPDFPRKVWVKEVDKMIKTFGAPINEQEAKEIVEYLCAVKGVKDKEPPK